MRVIESGKRFQVYLQRHSTQLWKGMTIRKKCFLGGASALTAALVVYVFKKFSSIHILVGCASVAVLLPCVLRGCSWLKQKGIRWCNAPDAQGNTLLMKGVVRRVPWIFLKALIKAGVDIHLSNRKGKTALMLAVMEAKMHKMKALIQAGADIEAQDNQGNTALMLAVKSGNLYATQALLQAGAHIESRDSGGYTAFMHAVASVNSFVTEALIQARANIEARDHTGYTAIMHTVRSEINNRGWRRDFHPSQLNMIRMLIRAGVNLAAQDDNGYTVLMLTAKSSSVNAVQAFIHAGAPLEALDNEGNTALMLAVREGDIPVTEALIQAKANVEARNHNGETALMLAASLGRANLIQRLIQANAHIEARNHAGDTALMRVARSGVDIRGIALPLQQRRQLEVIGALIQGGAYLEARDPSGSTVLMLAARSGSCHVISELIRAGANCQARDNEGSTALIREVTAQNEDTVTALLNQRAAVNCRDRRGRTPLMIVEAIGNRNIAQTLRDFGAVDNAPLMSFSLQMPTYHVLEHHVTHNRLRLKINRLNRSPAAAIEYLKVLSEYLRFYLNAGNGPLAAFSLSIRYEGEEGIDAGGPTREFITQLLKHFFRFPDAFPFFKQMENGQYELFDGMLTMTPQDLQTCKDIGMLLAAGFMGFPGSKEAKIGSVFSDRFYNQLLSLHQYAMEHVGQLAHGFNAMSQEDKELLVLHVASHDVENPIYKIIHHCLLAPSEVDKTDQELDALLKFIISSSFVEDIDLNLSSALAEILEAFKKSSNYMLFLRTGKFFTILGNEMQLDVLEATRKALRIALLDPQQKTHFKAQFVRFFIDRYQSSCIPLVAVEEGFRNAGLAYIKPFVDQFEINPQRAMQSLSAAVQGPAFTREAFVDLLKRSTAVNPAVQAKVNWIIEWCERGIEGWEETKATEEAMKAMLSCMTGTEVVTRTLVLRFNAPVPGYSTFHTCGHSVNFGSLLMGQVDKTSCIQMWNEHINLARHEGFGRG